MHHITLHTKDGFVLDADYYKGTNKKGIIFVHGISNDRSREEYFIRAARELNKKGLSTLLFDLRAHGESTGNSIEDYTISSQLIDIDTAVTFIREQGVKEIYLAGASFGAGAVCLYTKDHPGIAGLFLSNPVLDYDVAFLHSKNAWGKEHFGKYQTLLKQQGFVIVGSNNYKLGSKIFDEMKQYNPFESLKTFANPVYILHGDKDHILPYEDSINFFEELPNPKKKLTLIPEADHGFHVEPFTSQATEKVIDFFTTL